MRSTWESADFTSEAETSERALPGFTSRRTVAVPPARAAKPPSYPSSLESSSTWRPAGTPAFSAWLLGQRTTSVAAIIAATVRRRGAAALLGSGVSDMRAAPEPCSLDDDEIARARAQRRQ